MDMAKRRNLPVITFVDTLGAAPTIESERRGQSNQIARAIQAIRNHDKPVISVVTGGLGSGGGMAITNISPEFLALDDAQIWVAEPKSASSILHKIAQPTVEMVKHMLKEMKCTPFDIKKLGYPLRIIKSEEDLRNTIRNIRFAVLQSYQRQNGYGETKLHKLRTRIYRSMGKKAIKISQDQTVSKGGYISD